MNYLVDSYTIYAASVLAANSVFRAIFGAVFPLFTRQMYSGLGKQTSYPVHDVLFAFKLMVPCSSGIHWASTIPALLSLVCLPFPFLFYRFGARIRAKCKYSAIAAAATASLSRSTGLSEPAQAV